MAKIGKAFQAWLVLKIPVFDENTVQEITKLLEDKDFGAIEFGSEDRIRQTLDAKSSYCFQYIFVKKPLAGDQINILLDRAQNFGQELYLPDIRSYLYFMDKFCESDTDATGHNITTGLLEIRLKINMDEMIKATQMVDDMISKDNK